MINIGFFLFARLFWKMDKMYHCILNYNDIIIFVIFQIKKILLFFLTHFESMLSFFFCHNFLEAVKEFHKFRFYISINRTTLLLLFVGHQVRKIYFNVYQQSKFNYTHHLFFQNNINLSWHFQQVSTRIGANFKSNIFPECAPNFPPKIRTVFRSGLNIGIGALWENYSHRKFR